MFDKSICSLLNINSQNGSNPYVHPASKLFDRLGIEARRVRESVSSINQASAQPTCPNNFQQLITLLDLKQRFATIEDARLTATQTTILIIFTLATVIFVGGHRSPRDLTYLNEGFLVTIIASCSNSRS